MSELKKYIVVVVCLSSTACMDEIAIHENGSAIDTFEESSESQSEDDFSSDLPTDEIDYLESPNPDEEPVAFCEASCGPNSTVSCSGSSCSATDRNCDAGIRGSVTCNGATTQCPYVCLMPATDRYRVRMSVANYGLFQVHTCPNGVFEVQQTFECIVDSDSANFDVGLSFPQSCTGGEITLYYQEGSKSVAKYCLNPCAGVNQVWHEWRSAPQITSVQEIPFPYTGTSVGCRQL
jgi:hypothetical protein